MAKGKTSLRDTMKLTKKVPIKKTEITEIDIERTEKKVSKIINPRHNDIEKPESLEKMIELSEKLSEEFRYVRVDWYDVDGTLFFGELTFHHDSGNTPILPEEWDEKLGAKLIL